MQLLKNALQPAISDVKVQWRASDGRIIDDAVVEMEAEVETKKTLLGYMKPKKSSKVRIEGPAPAIMPPVYDGQRLLAYCLFSDKENKVRLHQK